VPQIRPDGRIANANVSADVSWHAGEGAILARSDFSRLFDALRTLGYIVIGPCVSSGAVHYDEIASVSDLPAGWRDEQDAGHYRLIRTGSKALFGYTDGAQSWKRFLFRPERALWQAERAGASFVVRQMKEEVPHYAFLGMRACELRAIEIQDHVLLRHGVTDLDYAARRKAALFIAVNCGHAGGTCFCNSMESGPQAKRGFDLALTELLDSKRHDFLVEISSARGAAVAAQLPLVLADAADFAAAERIAAQTAAGMGRQMETNGLKSLLQDNPEHSEWDAVAARCLACANCTSVCPTCFCHTEEDTTDLAGLRAERRQRWDSCFTLEFAHLPGGSVRHDVRARYRQWLTHKLANWLDQFGESGCVGCGRCITWCPAGIDITAEIAKFHESREA